MTRELIFGGWKIQMAFTNTTAFPLDEQNNYVRTEQSCYPEGSMWFWKDPSLNVGGMVGERRLRVTETD